MKKIFKSIFSSLPLIFLLLMPIIVFSSCAKDRVDTAAGDGKIIAVTSIVSQVEFIEKIGGSRISAEALIPPGASPHSYEPLPAQLKTVSNADIYLKVGSGIEFELAWMDKIIKLNSDMFVVNCSEGIDLIGIDGQEDGSLDNYENEEYIPAGSTDPHIWLSLRNAEIILAGIYGALEEIDPAGQKHYRQNLDSYINEIDALELRISGLLKGIRINKFIVLHPSWGYFARDYGLEQVAIEHEGKEPTLKTIMEIIDFARDNEIKVIFASPESNTAIAQSIASEIGGEVILVNPLEKDYLKNMEGVAQKIALALK